MAAILKWLCEWCDKPLWTCPCRRYEANRVFFEKAKLTPYSGQGGAG
jgi:hypothetical protein